MRRWSAVNLSIKDVENLGTVLRFLCQNSGCSLPANSAMSSNTQSLNLIQKPVTYVQRWRGVKKANGGVSAKRSRVKENDSNDSDFPLKLMEKITNGMDIG